MKKLLGLIPYIFVAACSGTVTDQHIPPLAAGRYYLGDGLGTNISIQLADDGSYTAEWRGCLGNYGNSSGRWRAAGEKLLFDPAQEDGQMVDVLKNMRIVEYKGKAAFLAASDLKDHAAMLEKAGKSSYVFTLRNLPVVQ